MKSFHLRFSILFMLVVATGCRPEDAVGPPGRVSLVSAGDRQVGAGGDRLPLPLEVTVRGEGGRPLVGVVVQWVLVTNGEVVPDGSTTDAKGIARAWFTLGTRPGKASVVAVIAGTDSVLFNLEVRQPDDTGGPFDTFIDLSLATFDGSGQTVHPDYALVPWAMPRRLAITPYPGGNAGFEIPSVFAGLTFEEWGLAPGASNPVVPAPAVGHLSDPDLVWNPESGEAWLYYREASDANIVWLARSGDGVRWSEPQRILSVPNHELLSPAVVRRGPSDWWMWSVNAGPSGCSAASADLEVRRSADGLVWSAPVRIDLAHDGLSPWHVDVRWIESRGEFWAVYNSKGPGGCTTPALFLARSSDGVHWTPIRRPLVAKGDHPALQDIVYRATFDYHPAEDRLVLWVSGARYHAKQWIWNTVLVSRRAAESLSAKDDRPLVFSPPPAELIDWP